MALFEKGNSHGGRKKGSKNRVTNDVRQVFHEVYNNMGDDEDFTDPKTGEKRQQTGHEAMLAWARENKTEFYRLYGKMIPATAEIMEDSHEDFVADLIFEEEEADLIEADATEVGNDGQLQLPSGEHVPDNAPHVGDIPIDEAKAT